MEIITKNRTYLSIKEHGKILPFQLGIFATSGHGKGLATEFIVQEWKRRTKGIVLVIADPKDEAEFSYVQYKPKEKYHVQKLQSDGIYQQSFKAKMYHPFTFNIPKGYLPTINFYTTSIKDLTREELSILAETPFDSESIKVMRRTAEEITKNTGMYEYLHEIQELVQGKKDKNKKIADPKNFYLSVGGGTAKSITEIAGFIAPFKKNYFLRKENCPYKLDWKNILTDNENYHIFLSMWLKDSKLKEFAVLSLLQQIINNRHHSTRPILIVIPEVRYLCPRNPQGYKYFLSQAITNALSTIRSMGRGMSSIFDSQNWEDTDDKIKGSATITLFGNLSTSDSERVCKAMQYKREIREKIQRMNKNCYLKYGSEEESAFRIFMPSHMHCEPEYNWIETYKEYYPEGMVIYDGLKAYMRKEIEEEERRIRELVKRKDKEEEKEKTPKKEEEKTPKKKENKEDEEKLRLQRLCWEMRNDERLEKREKSLQAIADKFKIPKTTVNTYIKKWEEKIRDEEEQKKSL